MLGFDNFILGLENRFYLYKENKDTQDALTVIGRMLHVQVFTHRFVLYFPCFFLLGCDSFYFFSRLMMYISRQSFHYKAWASCQKCLTQSWIWVFNESHRVWPLPVSNGFSDSCSRRILGSLGPRIKELSPHSRSKLQNHFPAEYLIIITG